MNLKIAVAVIASGVVASSSFGIDGLTLSVQSNHVFLKWPSQTNAAYIVQYRATLDPNDRWETVTNAYTAAPGTNRTQFVHSNSVCAPVGVPSGGGGGGTLPPFPSVSPDPGSNGESVHPAVESSLMGSGNSCASVFYGSNACSGFYRVFIPSPTARLDVFGVEQDSISNQLDILVNDEDANDNPIALSAVQAAMHGEIQYSDDATIFHYTPTNSFFGLDAFAYSITNDVGGSNAAVVYVFVNQAGNGYPSAPPLEFVLLTNQTVTTFSVLTNATDPDSDPLQVAVIEQPSRGIVHTNSSNGIVYTRTAGYVAQDSFAYVLTDNRGGFVKRVVVINPQDDDGDEIPDEWELHHDLSPTVNDAHDDPDADGIPNLAEYKLDTCPWVSDSPLNLTNIVTNQVFREYALISVPLKSHIDRPAVSLLINSNRADASLTKRADGRWYISWDTGYMENGNYSLALEFQHRNAPVAGDLPVVGTARGVAITNDVLFKKVNSIFNDHLVFDVKLALETAYWRIELFDEQNDYLGYFSGMTTNGSIAGSWDLTDGQGNQLATSHVRTRFYTSASTGSPPGGTTSKATRWFIKQVPGGVGDVFVVAWGWDYYGTSFYNRRTDLMLDGVINLLANPARNDEYTLLPGGNGFNAGAFRFDDEIDKAILIKALEESGSGNFFWFGHGATQGIQGNGDRATILSGDVERHLKNKKHRSTPKHPHENKHPYRLAILNGCNTYSSDWSNAFGIDFSEGGTTNGVWENMLQGRQSQAFVGWADSIDVPTQFAPAAYSTEYSYALAQFFSRWMDGYPLENCLINYANGMINLDGHDSWKISGTAHMWRTAP